ncbi:MAG: hypothetical protein ACFE9Z_06880 [Promethearchaeota archaeon]
MERLILTHWNTQTGPEVLIQYPPEKDFPSKELLLKIWAKHETNKENTMIEFNSEEDETKYLSIIQNYEGEIYFLILVYKQKENPEEIIQKSPEILALICKNLIELINTNKITRTISEAFNTIQNYSKLDEEENLISFFQDKIKFTILQILRKGVISKSELINILRHDFGFSTENIDLILISFLHENLLVKQNVPGSKECYFLVKDLSCIRIPPKNLPSNEKEEDYLRKFQEALKNYYLEYKNVLDFENKTIFNTVLFNKDVFLLIKTLREKELTVNDCLNLLNNKEELFEELLNERFIYEAIGFVSLFSDVRFIKFTPTYIIEKLIKRYNNQEISLNEYTIHLKLLIEQIGNSSSIEYEIV